MDNQEKITKLAQDVMKLAQSRLVLNFRFFDTALDRLPLAHDYECPSVATNGRKFLYNPIFVLKEYRDEQSKPARHYVHSLIHCILYHPFTAKNVDRVLWDLSSDIAVAHTLMEMKNDCIALADDVDRLQYISHLKSKVNIFTAEKIYRYFVDNPPSQTEIDKLTNLFVSDNHDLWYPEQGDQGNCSESDGQGQNASQAKGKGKKSSSNKGQSKDQDDSKSYTTILPDDDPQKAQGQTGLSQGALSLSDMNLVFEGWKDISQKILTDLKTTSKNMGSGAGALIQNLTQVNRERYDYTDFLRRFATIKEDMQVNPDEFDYIYYNYGMSVYKNMPLIEPLEYRDVKKIREFVIAIDVSGSVQGDLVQAFINKTYNILMHQESFFTKINLHIIQCDDQIQSDVKITTPDEFAQYLMNMQLIGFGGTDFRPVFAYVDELIAKREFTNLKGLIYFTDGYGVFPLMPPKYQTVFVMLRDGYEEVDVPSWAMKLILEKEDIKP